MPSSTYKIINQTVYEVLRVQPKSVLDIGIGFGKYGFLCREYLETWKDRVFPDQWEVKIDGIDIFQPYLDLEHNKAIYDNLICQNALEYLRNFQGYYDLIIAMDVVEHLPKEEGMEVVERILLCSQKASIINVPTGDWLHNKVVANNPAEEHQAIWVKEDLEKLAEAFSRNLTLVEWEQNGRTGCLGVFK